MLLRTRGVSLFALLALALPLGLIPTAREAWRWSHAASIGVATRFTNEVVEVEGRWRGVERGDLLVAIDGAPVSPSPKASAALEWLTPGAHTLTFERDGARFERSGEARPRRLHEQAAIWLRVTLGAVTLLIGLLAFGLSPGRRVSWLFLLFTAALAAFLWIVVVNSGPVGFMTPVMMLCLAAPTSLALHLFSVFPRPLALFTRRPWIALGFYLPSALLVALDLALWSTSPVIEYRSMLRILGSVWMGLSGLLLIGFIAQQYRQARRAGDYRAQVRARLVLIGVTLGLALPALWNALRLVFHINPGDWIVHLNTAPVAIFVALTAYALVRHNVLAVDRFALAVVGYAVTVGLLGVAFAAVLIGLPLLVGQASALQSPMAVAVMTALAFVGFSPLYRRLRRRVDQLFARGETGGGRAASVLRELTRVVQRAGRRKSMEAALDACGELRAERAELWLLDDAGERFERQAWRGRPLGDDVLPRDGLLARALIRAGGGGGLKGLAPTTLDAGAQTELAEHGLVLAAPITPFGAIAGLVGLGRKVSGTAFSDEDQMFVEAVSTQLAMVLERASAEGAALGRYRIERRLGVGGMAEVYLAWQLGPGGFERKVALKRLLPNLAEEPDLVAMFLDEARVSAQLKHRHIAQIYEVGKEGGQHFIAMEYVDGPSLRQLMRAAEARGEQLPASVAVAIGAATLEALAHAHQAEDARGRPLGVVHRDVTPSNVQLTRAGEIKLLDFGIARASTQLHVTRTGVAKGTLPYMSAEQVLAEPLDQRADVYSLSAVLYELLSGAHAFPDGPARARPPALSERRADIPPALAEAIAAGMAYEARDRPADASALRETLLAALSPVTPASQGQLASLIEELLPVRGRGGDQDDGAVEPAESPTRPMGPQRVEP